jgi:uncharacterized protein YndB with AHSA1/START domain
MMKKFALGFVIALALLFLGVLAAAMLRPKEYSFSRSTTISSSPADVYAFISDMKRFDEWSPWAKLDPSSQKTFEGSAGTEGQVYAWSGNDKVGEGKMRVTRLMPNQSVDIALEFIRPFADTANTSWSLKDEGSGTTVTWTMSGERKSLFQKVLGLVLPMDTMVGKDFEKGLAQLKTLVESPSSPTPPAEPVQTN